MVHMPQEIKPYAGCGYCGGLSSLSKITNDARLSFRQRDFMELKILRALIYVDMEQRRIFSHTIL